MRRRHIAPTDLLDEIAQHATKTRDRRLANLRHGEDNPKVRSTEIVAAVMGRPCHEALSSHPAYSRVMGLVESGAAQEADRMWQAEVDAMRDAINSADQENSTEGDANP